MIYRIYFCVIVFLTQAAIPVGLVAAEPTLREVVRLSREAMQPPVQYRISVDDRELEVAEGLLGGVTPVTRWRMTKPMPLTIIKYPDAIYHVFSKQKRRWMPRSFLVRRRKSAKHNVRHLTRILPSLDQ